MVPKAQVSKEKVGVLDLNKVKIFGTSMDTINKMK